jgi:DNA topoisomerase IA
MFKKPIKITQRILKSGYRHLETILLINDEEATRLSDWVVGYFHCKQCNTYKAYAGKLPSAGSVQIIVPKMINERNSFWREHHHGDGRIVLFEKDVEE